MPSPFRRAPLRAATLALACAAAALPAAAQSPAPADPQALLMQLLQQRAAQLGAAAPAAMPAPVAARPAAPAVTEAALAQQLAAWPASRGPFEVERFRDGFSINGQRMLDPEGQITHFSVDSQTGDYAYLVQVMPGQHLLKLARHPGGTPTVVANVTRQGGQWMAETQTGARLNGSRLILAPRGLMVARDNVLFAWTAGSGIQSYAAPETHAMAAHQHGDIAATGWVLMEKRAEAKESEGGLLGGTSLGALVGSVKRLGAAVGINGADTDYALFHLASRQMVPLGIAMEEKQAQFMSQCRQRNVWVSMCDRMDSLESLYGQDGYPNRGHYFWRVSWYATPRGPVAVVMENGIRKIDAIQLGTDQRATVFERALGIGNWSARQTADGRVRVQAQLGLDSGVNEDVAALFPSTVAAAAAPGATAAR